MILEKSKIIRLQDLSQAGYVEDDKADFVKDFIRINHIYRSAMQEASTRLDILDSEFATIYNHSPFTIWSAGSRPWTASWRR
ncbi:MAG: hypothetical protein LUF28_09710 [Clostridiales bacterium]|nr:hypothetical protein [Clostridiales bacterium]